MSNHKYEGASVKVMRSYDYCHFEVALSYATEPNSTVSLEVVDDMRKDAARLADKAVEQYKIAKAAKERFDRINEPYQLKRAQETPEDARTPQDKAVIKFHSDEAFRSRFAYDYQDDWERNPDWEDE